MDNNGYRKLTRSTSDRRIAGVCGGLAEYLNVDPTVVRIIFLLALICGTLGFWAYLIVWICAPEDNLLNQ
jgi:phage shock protein PspC (stress-responsive transcriptional regulator)